MKKSFLCLLAVLMISHAFAQAYIAEGRKPLGVIPKKVDGVSIPNITLNGTWEMNMNPEGEVWKTNKGNWQKIKVPGEPAMQGFKVVNDKEFFYRTTINIPADAKNKTVRIRFNGVYSYARVFVNGKMIRDHFGGFTAWEADISDEIIPGKPLQIYVGVTDRVDEISYASAYAKHFIGGILREVQLLILPKQHINRFYTNTELSNDYRQATLSFNIAKNTNAPADVKLQLTDASGKNVVQKNVKLINGSATTSVIIDNPVLWNEEQPYLYNVKADLVINGKFEETIVQKIGFRNVKVDGKRLLVNGMPVKLRGACRHDMHPLLGRSSNRYYDSLDVVQAKEANMNFIRTSHYPPTQDFLEFADRYGLYVQEETAVCFANAWREGIFSKWSKTQEDTAFTPRFLGQLSEMIDRDRNHPSIIMWSIGNESDYGINFQKSCEFVKSVDLSRPVSWTWPGNAIKENKRCFDIAITHYPAYNGSENENFGMKYANMEHDSFPLLGDEWAHVSCYNTTMLKLDPNVKDFWGRSLDTMWAKRFDVPGNLGGAIWGMIDETFHLPDTVSGYGPWGIVDVWRRKKTEFWNTKKAYSPVKVLQTKFDNGTTKQNISIPIKNRFNHLALNEIKMVVESGQKTWTEQLPALQPHEEGVILIAKEKLAPSFMLKFYNANKQLIDEEKITVNYAVVDTAIASQKWNIKNENGQMQLTNKNLFLLLDEKTGELQYASVGGEKILTGAPRFFVLQPKQYDAWKETAGNESGKYKVQKAEIKTTDGKVVVTSSGIVDSFLVKMQTTFSANGYIDVEYEADSIPKYSWQIGLAFPLTWNADAYEWKRNGYWTTYPDGHLSAHEGLAKRNTNIKEIYRQQPLYGVAEGMYDYYLTGKTKAAEAFMWGSEKYRAAKENITDFTIFMGSRAVLKSDIWGSKTAFKIQILSNGAQELRLIDKLDYWALSWGNYQGTPNPPHISGRASLKLVIEPNRQVNKSFNQLNN